MVGYNVLVSFLQTNRPIPDGVGWTGICVVELNSFLSVFSSISAVVLMVKRSSIVANVVVVVAVCVDVNKDDVEAIYLVYK